MARRRYQKPTPKKRGDQWTILVREDLVANGQRTRKVKRIVLGPSTLARADAERLRDDYLAGINHPNVGIGGACLFRDFVATYERDVLPTLASTSQERSSSVLKNHLKPEMGDLMLREITLEQLQGYFARLQQSKLSFESIDKIRDVLSAVLRTAVDYGRLLGNPAEKVRLKRRRPRGPKPFLRIEQFDMLLDAISEPYATMVYVAVFTALRVSELAGLRWRNIHASSITIEQRYSRGDFDEPKSQASRATIPVDAHVIERIERLKDLEVLVPAGWATRRYRVVKSGAPDDLVFQSVAKGAPMRDNNILTRLKTVSAPEGCRLQFSRVDLLSPSRRFLPVFRVKIMSVPIKGTLETILVVDDNEVILQAVVGILKHANFNVLSAANGPAAMRLAAESDILIHLLLSDVDMPEISGPDLGQTLKQTRPDIRIMLMSGGNNGNLLVLNYGWAYIQKPFLSARLVDMVTAVLHSPDRSQAGGQEFDTRKDARGDQKSS